MGAGSIPEAPPLQQQPDDAAVFNTRLAALMPRVKDAITAAGPNATDVKLKVSEAGVFARKKEFDRAHALLDEAEQLMDADAGGPSEAEEFAARRDELEQRMLAALKGNPAEATRMRAVFGYANEQAGSGQWAKAMNALNQLDKLLGGTGTGPGTASGEQQQGEREGEEGAEVEQEGSGPQTAGDMGYKGIVAYRTTLLELRAAVSKVEGQIAALVKAIPDQMPDEADLAEELAESLREANEELQDLVDEAMGTAENADTPITRALTARLDELIGEVAGNEVIKHVDKNPFGVAMSVESTLSQALKAVRTALPVPA